VPSAPKPCGILLHQRPLLQYFSRANDSKSCYFFECWNATAEEEITDQSLAEATYTIDEMNLVFLKVLIDGQPEIINVETPAGEFLTSKRLLNSPKTICVHLSNDPDSGFSRRQVHTIKFLAPLRDLKIHSHGNPTRVAVPAFRFPGGAPSTQEF
jgi:hypothetical protein